MMKFFLTYILLSVSMLMPTKAKADPIYVYAAASMTDVIQTLADMYQRTHSDTVIPVFAGSSTLARQIEQGANADLFISANVKWMEYLQENGTVQAKNTQNLLMNQLVLIAHTESLEENTDSYTHLPLQQRLQKDRFAMGEPNSVPAGMYAKESLTSLGVWPQVADNAVFTNNVRLTLSLVERGEALFGIVYRTDALMSQKVKVIYTFPDESHSRIIYPINLLNDKASSRAFFQFLLTEEAQETFVNAGFSVIHSTIE